MWRPCCKIKTCARYALPVNFYFEMEEIDPLDGYLSRSIFTGPPTLTETVGCGFAAVSEASKRKR